MIDINNILKYSQELKVLYVEDENNIRKTTKELLEIYFNDVDTAVDGQDGLNKYSLLKDQENIYYDLVITDLEMPNLGGLDMCEKILELNEFQSIIIISAHNDTDFLHKAIDFGVTGYLNKPINLDQLGKILYKTSQAISDRKFVEAHLDLMERMNIRLENKNRELQEQLELNNSIVTHNDPQSFKTECQHLKDDDLYELIDILTAIDIYVIDIIKNGGVMGDDVRDSLLSLFERYSTIISSYLMLEELYKVISEFAATLKEQKNIESKKLKNCFAILENVLYSISEWNKELQKNSVDDIKPLKKDLLIDFENIVKLLQSGS
jgi:CheY-like chemotaxis protein